MPVCKRPIAACDELWIKHIGTKTRLSILYGSPCAKAESVVYCSYEVFRWANCFAGGPMPSTALTFVGSRLDW